MWPAYKRLIKATQVSESLVHLIEMAQKQSTSTVQNSFVENCLAQEKRAVDIVKHKF